MQKNSVYRLDIYVTEVGNFFSFFFFLTSNLSCTSRGYDGTLFTNSEQEKRSVRDVIYTSGTCADIVNDVTYLGTEYQTRK